MSPVALITGASRGIGRAIALAFARRHYRLALNYRTDDRKADETAEEAAAFKSQVMLLKADVRNSEEVAGIVQSVLKEWGRVDVLVNNADVERDRSILKMSDEEWNEVLRVDLTGAFWCLRECAKVMVKQKSGSIVNISSIVGVRGTVGGANYASAKSGLIALTKSAAKELGRFNLKVNAVLPGFHLTDMGAQVWGTQSERIRAEHTLGRLTDLQELAEFVVQIASQNSASGQVFNFESRVL